MSYKLQNAESDTMTLVVRRNGEKITLKDVKFYNTATQGRQEDQTWNSTN